MKLYNLTKTELLEVNGGSEEGYQVGRAIGEHIRGLIDAFKGLF